MAVYFTAAALLCFYLCAVPLKLAFLLRSSPQLCVRAAGAPFENRFALRRAASSVRKRKKRRLPDMLTLRSALPALRWLLRRVHLEYLHAEGTLSSPDAARTALLWGLLQSLRGALSPLGERAQIHILPDFSAERSRIEAAGMIRLRAGHIILAVLIFAGSYLKERFKTWKTDIPSKISCRPPWKASATWWTWTP